MVPKISRGEGNMIRWITATAYLASIVFANWVVSVFGFVPVGFGLVAPAAVYIVGVTFTLRDFAQEQIGKRSTVGLVFVGAAASAVFSPQIALASGLAFLLSELADMVIFTWLRDRTFTGAVFASNAVSLVVDSILFLVIAFGSLEYLPGQVWGKLWATIAAVLLIFVIRRYRRFRAAAI